jgi:hypothetical protein
VVSTCGANEVLLAGIRIQSLYVIFETQGTGCSRWVRQARVVPVVITGREETSTVWAPFNAFQKIGVYTARFISYMGETKEAGSHDSTHECNSTGTCDITFEFSLHLKNGFRRRIITHCRISIGHSTTVSCLAVQCFAVTVFDTKQWLEASHMYELRSVSTSAVGLLKLSVKSCFKL